METPPGPHYLVKLGVLIVGVLILAYAAFWPMYQVTQGVKSVNVWFKLILLGAMMTMAGLNLVLMGEHALPWKKRPEDPVTGPQKIGIVATVVGALAVTGGVWLFFHNHGYQIGF